MDTKNDYKGLSRMLPKTTHKKPRTCSYCWQSGHKAKNCQYIQAAGRMKMNNQLNAWEIFSIIESLKQRAILLRHEGTELDRIGKSASAGDELRVVARCIDDLILKLDKSNSVTIR